MCPPSGPGAAADGWPLPVGGSAGGEGAAPGARPVGHHLRARLGHPGNHGGVQGAGPPLRQAAAAGRAL